MKKIILTAVFLIAAGTIFSQQIGVWKNYTDVKNIKEAKGFYSGVWAATEGGAFYSSNASDTYLRLVKADGLNSHNLTAVTQDSQGKIWFGTVEGVINVYNPETKTIKKVLDIAKSDKTKKGINDFFIAGNDVYTATDFGISIINSISYSFNETIQKFGDFPSGEIVNSVSVGSVVYACTETGIAIQKSGATNLSAPESWKVYYRATDLGVKTVSRLVEFNSELIVATDKGLYKLESNVWNKLLSDQTEVFDMVVYGNSLYILRANQLQKYDGSTLATIYTSAVQLNDIDVVNENLQYISSTHGLIKLENGIPEIIIPNGPETNSFQNLAVDTDGNLWVASGRDVYGQGFFKFDGSNWTNYNLNTMPELPSNAYHNVNASPSDNVYFSNWGGGFTRLKDGVFQTFNASNTNMAGMAGFPFFVVIYDVVEDSKGNAWIMNHIAGDSKIVSVLTPDSAWYHYAFGSPLSPSAYETERMVIDQYDTKWFVVSTGSRGLYYFNENGTLNNLNDDDWGLVRPVDGLNSDIITAMAVDKRGELWVGTSLGMNIIPNTTSPKSSITSIFGLRQQTITAVIVDPLNQKWVGTKQGVFVMSPDGTRLIAQYDSKNSPLPVDDIKSIAIDEKSGTVYIGTDQGGASVTTAFINPDKDFKNLFVYPNPFLVGEGENRLSIDGLIADSYLKILSVSGALVRDIVTLGGRVAFWDGRDSNNNLVASGIYIIVAYDEEANNVASTKVAVIRK
ncbi:MAG: hypothetical protein KKD86_04225 [Bacteroidetes bacterium]|nr:hypothetical protein [Bacteroidota bacterium]MBU1678049.1 hypothetical protein [Bacteroidota bacterium]